MQDQVIETLESMNAFLMSDQRDDPTFRTSLLEALQELAPLVGSVSPDAQAAYIAITQRMVRSQSPLIDPRTGVRLEG